MITYFTNSLGENVVAMAKKHYFKINNKPYLEDKTKRYWYVKYSCCVHADTKVYQTYPTSSMYESGWSNVFPIILAINSPERLIR